MKRKRKRPTHSGNTNKAHKAFAASAAAAAPAAAGRTQNMFVQWESEKTVNEGTKEEETMLTEQCAGLAT